MDSLKPSPSQHSASLPTDERKAESTTILSLPPELLLRTFVFVARCGDLRDLARLRQINTTFCTLLSDSGPQNDRLIWREAAVSLLGKLTPPVLTIEATWQEFVKRIWVLSKPNKKGEDEGSGKRRYVREIAEGERLYTSHNGPFPPPIGVDQGPLQYAEYVELPRCTEQLLTPVPAGARRIIDFVHSGTEGCRSDQRGAPYSGADSGAFITFSDVSEFWHESDGMTSKGYIVADIEAAKAEKHLITGGVQDLAWLDALKTEYIDVEGFTDWIRSCVHSDANLLLVPASTELAGLGKLSLFVSKVVRYSAPDVVDKEWEFVYNKQHTLWATEKDGFVDEPLEPRGPWVDESYWEFRSAGDYLVACDDNHGLHESTVRCFSHGKSADPLWKRTMTQRIGNRTFFRDNDGVKMNCAVVAFASRSLREVNSPAHARAESLRVAEFVLMSTRTGDILYILSLPQEAGPSPMDDGINICAWCSFALTETLLVATVGGRLRNGSDPSNCYEYREAFVWDLTATSRTRSPIYAIPLPKNWNAAGTYVALSPDGRWLGIQGDWELVVVDLAKQTQVGVWRISQASQYNTPVAPWENDRVAGWNGVWVVYRDVYDDPASCDGQTLDPSRPRPDDLGIPGGAYRTSREDGVQVVEHHVTYLTCRVLRRIMVHHEVMKSPNEPPPNEPNLLSDDEPGYDSQDDGDGMSVGYYESSIEPIYQDSDDENFNTDMWSDTNESDQFAYMHGEDDIGLVGHGINGWGDEVDEALSELADEDTGGELAPHPENTGWDVGSPTLPAESPTASDGQPLLPMASGSGGTTQNEAAASGSKKSSRSDPQGYDGYGLTYGDVYDDYPDDDYPDDDYPDGDYA